MRPLPTELLDAAYEDTIHLLRLQRVLLREMLVEFKAAVQIYLNFSTTAMEDMERCKVILIILLFREFYISLDLALLAKIGPLHKWLLSLGQDMI